MYGVERQQHIEKGVHEHYREAEAILPDKNCLLCVCLQGSQNYKLDIYSDDYVSDIDTKAITLPTFEQFCQNTSPLSTTHIRSNDEHIDLKDIRVIFETFKKQNVNFVEILFSPWFEVNPMWEREWRAIRALGESLTSCHPAQTLRTMAGMSMEKLKALKHPYPTIKWKIDKWGYDGKQLHCIIRIHEFMLNYLKGMSFAEALITHDDDYLGRMQAAKLNKFTLEEADALANEFNARTQMLKSDYIDRCGDKIISTEPYEQLNEIKVEVLKKWFRYELNKI